jgi:hypothetical protein
MPCAPKAWSIYLKMAVRTIIPKSGKLLDIRDRYAYNRYFIKVLIV